MDLILTRTEYREDGIFGEIKDLKYNFLFSTLEHAYLQSDGTYAPKIPKGKYKCIRYESPRHGYEVFLLTGDGADGHFYELHIGNYNEDSDGCPLLGLGIGHKSNGGRMIVNSRLAFKKLMSIQNGQESFYLKVE